MSTTPERAAGEVTIKEVSDTTERLVPRLEPKETELAAVNPLPVTVTVVPPAVLPEDGDTAVTVGAAGAGAVNVK